MKLKIHYRKKNRKRDNTWRLKNMLLINNCFNAEIKAEIRKYLEINETGKKIIQNL